MRSYSKESKEERDHGDPGKRSHEYRDDIENKGENVDKKVGAIRNRVRNIRRD